MAKWLFVASFQAVVYYAERDSRPAGVTKRRFNTVMPFIPFHVLYTILFILNFVPSFDYRCREEMHFPVFAVLGEVAFFAAVICVWVLKCKNWYIPEDEEQLDSRRKAILALYR